MPDKRVDALNSITKNDYYSKHTTLSDNTSIGVNLINDLIKYFMLEFKNKYRYNYRKWTREVISESEIYPGVAAVPVAADAGADAGTEASADAAVDAGAEANKIIYKIIHGEGDDDIAFRKLNKYINNIYSKNLNDSDYIEIPEKIFNSDIALRKNYRDKSINEGYIPVIKIEGTPSVYYKPLLEYNYTNYDFQEKSQIYDDLNKLNSIFKKDNYKDLDDLVILKSFKEFTSKIEKLKSDIISRDDDVKYDLIDNIYDKLAIIYEIKMGRNKKIAVKPIKEIVETANKNITGNQLATKNPNKICEIYNDDRNILFNEILCEINKRAQKFNNLTKSKKGGKKATVRGGGGGDGDGDKVKRLEDSLEKILLAVSADNDQRYKTYLEIDKNILEKFIDDEKFKEHIDKLQNSKSVNKVSELAQEMFKGKPKKINGKVEKSSITFDKFNDFIEKIKDKASEDSNRYLAIIKSLNIIMKNTLGLPLIETQPPQPPQPATVKPADAEEEAGKLAEQADTGAAKLERQPVAETAQEAQAAVPAAEAEVKLAAEQSKVPAAEQSNVPAAEQSKVPAAEAEVKLAAEQSNVPAAEQSKVPAAEAEVKLAAEQSKVLAAEAEVKLAAEQSNVPAAEAEVKLAAEQEAPNQVPETEAGKKLSDSLNNGIQGVLRIAKSLSKLSGGGYQKENVGNVSKNQGNQGNQGRQKQVIEEEKMSGNPGKEYLKNLKDIYINLAKEYGKFIKDESEVKKLIKTVIQSQEDKDKVSASKDEQSDDESSKAKIEEIKKEFELRYKEYQNIDRGLNKVKTLAADNKSGKRGEKEGEDENKQEKESLKSDIESKVATYKTTFTELTGLKDKLINEPKDGKEELHNKFDTTKKELIDKEEEINRLIKSYRLRFGSGDNELANEETNKQLEELENQNKENEKKSKNLEERKKQLAASLKVIKEELRKLYKACIDINLPYATEYNDFVKNIIKVGQLKYLVDDNPQINNNNEIIDAYNKELDRIDKELGNIKIDINSNTKKIKDKMEITKSQAKKRGGGAVYRGGNKEDDDEKKRLTDLLRENLYKLINDKAENNLLAFIAELKTVFDNDDDNDIGTDNASGKKYNEKETLYEQIWNDYSDGVKSYYNSAKGKSALTYINEGEKLKNKIILYDLDPEIVLKITFQDKVVFLALMFAIRTFIMVLFEFLIDYNVVKSLRYAILIYATFYILILLLFTAFVNLDSYKLRIVFNYLNMHINTPGIILHIMLFIIFSLLVIIIIQTDNFINNLGDILDYTYIYNYIYTFNFDNILSGEFENNLTKDEKIKLQYRLDIISMLIFIFSGTLILLM